MSSEQSNVLKRHEQITKWYESETDKASKLIKEAEKIKFTKEVQFLSACNSNDWDEIGRLLSEGIDINSAQDDGLTSLHQACIDDDEHLVKYLIEHGANIDSQDKEGWTPLFAAISCNYLPITKYLVSSGARLDMVSFDGELPLDQSNNDTIASYIKDEMSKQNLDPEEIRNRERTVMLMDVEAMKLSKNYSNFILVDNGGSLLHIAASKDYMDVLERLLEIISPEMLNHTDNDGWNALHVAAHWGNRKACVMLINADIDFDKVTGSNQTVLEVSDDEVKPYIREEIRKARFRRQERASIKRPAETSTLEFKPSETKIVCQDKKTPSDDNHQHQEQKSNGDKHVMSTENSSMASVIEDHESKPSPGGTPNIINLMDVKLRSNAEDTEMEPSEKDNPNVRIPKPVSRPAFDNSKQSSTVEISKPSVVNSNTEPVENSKPTSVENSKQTSPVENSKPTSPVENSKPTPSLENSKQTPVKDAESTPSAINSQQKSPVKDAKPTSLVENVNHVVSKEDSQTVKDMKTTKVLMPSKAAESESQRKDKARHVRSTRRSTQGVTAEDIDEAKKMISFDKNNISEVSPVIVNTTPDQIDSSLPQSNNRTSVENTDLKAVDHESEVTTNKSLNGDLSSITVPKVPDVRISTVESEPPESSDKKGKTGGHVVNKRRTRERPPTGIVDPKDVQAALQAASESTKLPDVKIEKEPEINYKVLYENELKEIEKLQRHLSRLRHDLEQSEDTIKSLQNNNVVPKLQPPSSIMSPGCDIKEIEKLRDDNKKMKEANSALIRVISRLSHQPPKSVTGSN